MGFKDPSALTGRPPLMAAALCPRPAAIARPGPARSIPWTARAASERHVDLPLRVIRLGQGEWLLLAAEASMKLGNAAGTSTRCRSAPWLGRFCGRHDMLRQQKLCRG